MDKTGTRHRGSVTAMIAGIVVGAGLVSVWMLVGENGRPRPKSPLILSEGFGVLDPNAPLLAGGTPVTIQQASALVDYPLHLPNHALASNDTVTEGYVAEDDVALMV